MLHRRRSRISRFQLYIALTGLAFTVISAGIGLMQTYYSARVITAMNSSKLSQSNLNSINIQSNFMFPLGEFLLIVGLAIISSILLQFLLQSLSYLESRAKQRTPIRIRAEWIVLLAVGITLCIMFFPPDVSTIFNLVNDLKLHHNLPGLFLILTLLATSILYADGRSRR